MDPFSYLRFAFVFVILSCLILAVVWSSTSERAKLLALLFMMFSCVFVTFPYSVLGQVW